MLDQNTDRMWYVIGAVIIGAAIILILNGTMPQIFASVADTFSDKTEETTAVVDGMDVHIPGQIILGEDDIEEYYGSIVSYDNKSRTWTVDVTPSIYSSEPWSSQGLALVHGSVIAEYGQSVRVSYEILIPEGSPDMYAVSDIDAVPVDTSIDQWWQYDNDNVSKRQHGSDLTPLVGDDDPVALATGKWTTVWYSLVNTNPYNDDKIALTDVSGIGVRNTTGADLRVQIRNIKAVVR